jgi:penicillin G amidase
MKWFKGALWAVAALALLLAVAGAVYTTRAMPTVDGELRVAGLQQPVHIERDPHGIPTIKAQNQHDLMFALGFVHAQDRLWQLETHRRIGSGRLAEAFGEPALASRRSSPTSSCVRSACAVPPRRSGRVPVPSRVQRCRPTPTASMR